MSAMVDDSFADWLQTVLLEKGLTQAQLARKAGVTRSTINGVITGNRGPGTELCLGIAYALDIPPVIVYRAAGLLPPDPEKDELIERAEHLIASLKYPQTKRTALALLETLVQQEEKGSYDVGEDTQRSGGAE